MDVFTERAENEFSQEISYEEDMPTTPERISSLEHHVSTAKGAMWAFGLISFALIGLGSWLLKDVHDLDVRVGKLEQDLKDHGLEVVRAIEKPEDQKQLAANLSLVASQVRVARSEHRTPNRDRIARLSSAVEAAAVANPDIPEAWEAAYQLVDYRFSQNAAAASVAADLPLCLRSSNSGHGLKQLENTPPGPKDKEGFHLLVDSCVIDLDDLDLYEHSEAKIFFKKMRLRSGSTTPRTITFENVIVRYHGGPLIPIEIFEFAGCVFELDAPTGRPPPRAQSLAAQLLVAPDPSKAQVQLGS